MNTMELLNYHLDTEFQLVNRSLCNADEAVSRVQGYTLALVDNGFLTKEGKTEIVNDFVRRVIS